MRYDVLAMHIAPPVINSVVMRGVVNDVDGVHSGGAVYHVYFSPVKKGEHRVSSEPHFRRNTLQEGRYSGV